MFGFDEAYPFGELDARLPDLIANQEQLHTPVGADAAWDVRSPAGSTPCAHGCAAA
jgi:Xaa-Pro aminopeptidase